MPTLSTVAQGGAQRSEQDLEARTGDGASSGAKRWGETLPALALSNVQTMDEGNYTVIASNSMGSITSNAATLVVNIQTPGGGGSGGGAMGEWFIELLVAATALRCGKRYFRHN